MFRVLTIGISMTMIGCTTGSKYRYIENHYTNVQSPVEYPVYVETPVYRERPVYHYDSRRATMADLGKSMGEKMLRKMRAAYNEN
jgi:hypothetical protein